MQLSFDSYRSEFSDSYLEFISVTNLHHDGVPYDADGRPECIATIAAIHDSGPLMYAGVFGRFTCWGYTVAEAKESLFQVIQRHFDEYGTVYVLA